MTFPIQRVPRGLSDALSIFGGQTPQALALEVRGTLDLLQFYGQTQLQTLNVNDPALVEAGLVQVVPSLRNWIVLFAAQATVVKTATMTALRLAVAVQRLGQLMQVTAAELGPFGATETGTVGVPWVAPYPWICPPNTAIMAQLQILGTDANANVSVRCEFGVLG